MVPGSARAGPLQERVLVGCAQPLSDDARLIRRWCQSDRPATRSAALDDSSETAASLGISSRSGDFLGHPQWASFDPEVLRSNALTEVREETRKRGHLSERLESHLCRDSGIGVSASPSIRNSGVSTSRTPAALPRLTYRRIGGVPSDAGVGIA